VTVKFGKLIRLLGSNQPGEVAAAAAAIVRALQAAGKDIHTFADAAERGLQEPAPAGAPWRKLRAFCAEHHELLTAREREFIVGLARWRGRPTQKQMDWLEAIAEKIRERQAR
jgi:hypothetical protein